MAVYQKPIFYYDNAARRSKTGDDGTSYASCSEALEDPDDPYKVRGDILRSADIPALSNLAGADVVMAASGRRYRTLSLSGNPYAAALETLLMPYAENSHGQMVKVGSYLYTVVNKTVFKLNPSVNPPSIVARCPLPMSETNVFQSICSDGARLYVGSYSTLKIYVVRLHPLQVEASPVLSSSYNNGISCMTADTTGLFVAGYQGGTESPCVDKYTLGTAPALVATNWVYFAGIEGIYGLYTGTADGYLYASGQINSGGYKACILKINKVTMATVATAPTTSAVPGGTTDIQGAGLCSDGSSLFTTFWVAGGQGYIAKASLSSFPATLTQLSLAAGENYPAGCCTDNTSVFINCNTSAIKMVKVTIASFTRAAGWTLNAGENGTSGWGNILWDGAAVQVGCTTSPAIMVENSTTARVGALTYLKGLVDHGYGVKLDGQYAYLAFPSSPARIAKLDLVSKVLVCILELNTGENSVNALDIGTDGNLYALCGTTPAILVQIDIVSSVTSMTRLASCTLTTGAGSAGPGNALKVTGDRAYCGVGTTSGKIMRVNCSTMVQEAEVVFTAGRNDVRTMEIVGSTIYAGCYSNHLVKCTTAPFAESGAVDCGNPVLQSDSDASYVYVIMNAATNNIRRVAISGLVLGTALSTTGGAAPKCCALAGSSLHVFSGTSRFDVIDLSAWQIILSVTSSVIDTITQAFKRMLYYGGYYYLVNGGGAGWDKYAVLYRVDPHSSVTLYDRMQESDLGDAFTLRASLLCGQQDPAAPVGRISDGLLSPAMKGLVNTELKIRIHLPNMIEDGGFESGVININGYAGANWGIDSTNKLEGAYSAKWDTAANSPLFKYGKAKMKKGRTYTVLCKLSALTGNPVANVLRLDIKNRDTLTSLDASAGGFSPTVTTASNWHSFDIIPDFDSDRWLFYAYGQSAYKGSATGIMLDEVYVYDKLQVSALIVGRHNWTGRGPIKVNAWRCSPLRSTASIAAGDGVELASFTCDSIATVEQALTSNAYPVFELVIPAVASWAAELGEVYIGSFWQSPRWFRGPLNPYKTDEGGQRTLRVNFGGLPSTLRPTIEDLFDRFRDHEPVWVKHDTDSPVYMSAKDKSYDAPQNGDKVDLTADLVEAN